MSQTTPIADAAVSETPLAAALARENSVLELKMHGGAQTPLGFAGIHEELRALLESAGVFDLGYRTFLRVGGKDRVRWLNGMITQNVKGMGPGEAAYTLVLNPQGRIQGDADLFVQQDVMFLKTDRSQSERLLTHLRRYIIMDDVQLEPLDAETTALGIAGPRAAAILEKLGAAAPQAGTIRSVPMAGIEVELIGSYSPVVPRFEVHVPAARAMELWNVLTAAGAIPCGIRVMEDFRVLEGVPRFDVDFSDKYLPQEANLLRALHFTKGCYIGQEIVERIRARATVHRSLRQFDLQGTTPQPAPGTAVELRSGGAAVGELTSVSALNLPGLPKTVALGTIRVEALERSGTGTEPLTYDGGIAVPLTEPPQAPNF